MSAGVSPAVGPAILYVGRVSWEKGLRLMALLSRRLHARCIAHRIVVAGGGPALAELKRQLPDAVFTGNLSRPAVAEAFASADVFAFPSRTDTAGNVVLEAQASGLPVVVSDAGGPRENLVPGETGLVCEGSDPEAWADAVGGAVDRCRAPGALGHGRPGLCEPAALGSVPRSVVRDVPRRARRPRRGAAAAAGARFPRPSGVMTSSRSADRGRTVREQFSNLRFNDANRVPFPFAQVKRAMSAYITISTTGTSRPSVSSLACSSRTPHPAPRPPARCQAGVLREQLRDELPIGCPSRLDGVSTAASARASTVAARLPSMRVKDRNSAACRVQS